MFFTYFSSDRHRGWRPLPKHGCASISMLCWLGVLQRFNWNACILLCMSHNTHTHFGKGWSFQWAYSLSSLIPRELAQPFHTPPVVSQILITGLLRPSCWEPFEHFCLTTDDRDNRKHLQGCLPCNLLSLENEVWFVRIILFTAMSQEVPLLKVIFFLLAYFQV